MVITGYLPDFGTDVALTVQFQENDEPDGPEY